MSTKQIIDSLIESSVGVNSRADCPLCGRAGSVRVKKYDNNTVVKCFGGDCDLYGYRLNEITPDTLRVVGAAIAPDTLRVEDAGVIPGGSIRVAWGPATRVPYEEFTFVPEVLYPEARVYTGTAHIEEKNLASNLIRTAPIQYHPRLDRWVFISKSGAVGRRRRGREFPKWYTYGDTKVMYFKHTDFRTTPAVVITEDAASALSVTRVWDGLAILGTSFKEEMLTYLEKYDKINIMLDEDAIYKAHHLRMLLMEKLPGKDIHVIYSKKEPKELKTQELIEVLNGS